MNSLGIERPNLADGKIARAWYYWDTATLLRQLRISTESASV